MSYSIHPKSQPSYSVFNDINNDYPELTRPILKELETPDVLKNKKALALCESSDIKGLENYLVQMDNKSAGYAQVLAEKSLIWSYAHNNQELKNFLHKERNLDQHVIDDYLFVQAGLLGDRELLKVLLADPKTNMFSKKKDLFNSLIKNESWPTLNYLLDNPTYVDSMPLVVLEIACENLNANKSATPILEKLLKNIKDLIPTDVIKLRVASLLSNDVEKDQIWKRYVPDDNAVLSYAIEKKSPAEVEKLLSSPHLKSSLDNNSCLLIAAKRCNIALMTYFMEKSVVSPEFTLKIITEKNLLKTKLIDKPEFTSLVLEHAPTPDFSPTTLREQKWMAMLRKRDISQKLEEKTSIAPKTKI